MVFLIAVLLDKGNKPKEYKHYDKYKDFDIYLTNDGKYFLGKNGSFVSFKQVDSFKFLINVKHYSDVYKTTYIEYLKDKLDIYLVEGL